jgi:hypothetical protein
MTLARGTDRIDSEQVPDDIELLFERELGYTFERSSWGNGYASEAARCVFDYACDALNLRRVVSIIHSETCVLCGSLKNLDYNARTPSK